MACEKYANTKTFKIANLLPDFFPYRIKIKL